MVMWPWSKFRALERLEALAHANYDTAAERARKRSAALLDLRTKHAVLEERLRARDFRIGELEALVQQRESEMRRLAEVAGAKPIRIDGTVFDEDPREPTHFVDLPGATGVDIEQHVMTARSLKGEPTPVETEP